MIEKIIPDRISLTLPTVFGDELTFLEFCGKVRAKLNECIDVVNENTTDIQQNASAISRNESDIVKLNGVVNSVSAQADENTVSINTVSGKVDKNTADIQQNASAIQQNTTDIQQNTTAIQQNTTDIQQNTTAIQQNTTDIQQNSSAIQQNTTAIQQNATAISRNESDIVKLNGVVNSVSAQTDENTVNINTVSGKVDKLSKNFELIEQFTLTEDVTQIYRNQKPNGEAYNFNDVIMTLNIPIIEEGSTEAYGGTFMYIVNSEIEISDHRVVAQGGAFKKGQVSNISVRAKIEGGMVFGDYAASTGNTSNKQAAFTSYSNMGMLSAENITSILFNFFGQPIFSGTTIKIYAR